MHQTGRSPLDSFALYVLRPTWIGGKPEPSKWQEVAWQGIGPQNVPITALQNGFVIFEFDQSTEYAGGAIPPYTLPVSRKIPTHVTRADRDRLDLGYRRCKYMNAFLLALHSGFSSVEKAAKVVQEPVDPTNYFVACRCDSDWEIYMNDSRRFDCPESRVDNIEIETLDYAIEILRKLFDKIGVSCLEILSLVYISCYQYSRHQFSSAHLIAWSVVEALQNKIWLDLQTEVDVESGGHTKMTKKRKDQLNGRDFTASIVSQILSICGYIDDKTLTRLDEARKRRNNFAHTLDPIESDAAGQVIRLATDLISRVAAIRVTSPLSITSWL